jgi:hypothetical protein
MTIVKTKQLKEYYIMNKFTKDEIVNELTSGITSIMFRKKDGTIRKMNATRNEAFIPEDMQPKSDKPIKENDEVVKAFDTEINQWRSFRIDSLLLVKGISVT